MSTAIESTKAGESFSAGDLLTKARSYLTGRRGLILLALAIIGAGVTLNWGWLVAIGIAPILLALAPCAAMCALGVCMSKMGGKSCSNESAQPETRK